MTDIAFLGQPEAGSPRPFSAATVAGGLVFVSGHSAPHDPARGIHRGQTPAEEVRNALGRVAEIRFDPQTYEANVVLDMDSRYEFPKDTFASILTSGLLGEQYVGLDAGGDEEMIPAGGKISKTQSAIVLEKLISQFLFNKASEGKKDAAAQ